MYCAKGMKKLSIMTLLRPLVLISIFLSTLCSIPCFAQIMSSDTGVGEVMEGGGSGKGEGHCSDDSLGNESSCRLSGLSTQTLVPKDSHGDCLPQAGRYLSCFSRKFEGCVETEREYHDCLARLGNRLVRSKHGYLFVSNSNQLLAASIELYGEWLEHELQTCLLFLGPKQEVVEVGTRAGAHIAPMSRAVGPAGNIIGIESGSDEYTIASGTGVVNTVFNLKMMHAHAGESDNVNPGGGVKHVSIDGLALVRPRLLKLHCGNGTNEVIMGAQSTIVSYKPVVYMDMHGSVEGSVGRLEQQRHGGGGVEEGMGAPAAFGGECEGVYCAACESGLEIMMSIGYSCWVDTLPLFNPENFRQNSGNFLGDFPPTKMLLCVATADVESNQKVRKRIDAMQPFRCIR